VVVHSDNDRPETVTVDGRTWTAHITFGEDRMVLDVTGRMTAAAGLIVGSFLYETTDRTAMDGGRVGAHLKRRREQAVRYMPA